VTLTHRHPSPLRYPGGKAVLAPLLADLLVANDLHDGTVVEPFAGGAGASLQLLFSEFAGSLLLNDADRRVTAFWRGVLNQPDELIERILASKPNITTWRQCRAIYSSTSRSRQLDMAFAVFFLNRCSRSGVLVNGGPIGGLRQLGKWKLGARYNRADLARRIRRVAGYRESITVTTLDARTLLRNPSFDVDNSLVFLDPPYYEKGQRLYLNSLGPNDHAELASILLNDPPFRWVLTYDDVPAIRALYADIGPRTFRLGYSAYERRVGKELIVFDPRLAIPDDIFRVRNRPGRIRFGAFVSAAAS
jgi:DNA adenine methylase